MNLEPDSALCFVHIPKTGGTTLHHVLREHFSEGETCPERFNHLDRYAPAELAAFRFFSGHFDLAAISRIPARLRVVTMLRRPQDRILSLYHFWRAHRWEHIKQHNLVGPRLAKSLDLLSFLRHRSDGVPANIDNVMVRTLCGGGECGAVDAVAGSPDRMLARAKRKLETMTAFGITERYTESVQRICCALGVSAPAAVPRMLAFENLNSHPHLETVARVAITPLIERELRILTSLDDQLYAHALDVFVSSRP